MRNTHTFGCVTREQTGYSNGCTCGVDSPVRLGDYRRETFFEVYVRGLGALSNWYGVAVILGCFTLGAAICWLVGV